MHLANFSFNTIDGKPFDVSELSDKKVMIVNTASACGLTPQFEQLEELNQNFKDKGFVVIGFPSNDFAAQDPGTNDEIALFCQKNYGVTFPMMEKVVVKGEGQHPLFKWLTDQTGEEVKWNFHKYLIDEKGNFIKDLNPQVLPIDDEVLAWIEGGEI